VPSACRRRRANASTGPSARLVSLIQTIPAIGNKCFPDVHAFKKEWRARACEPVTNQRKAIMRRHFGRVYGGCCSHSRRRANHRLPRNSCHSSARMAPWSGQGHPASIGGSRSQKTCSRRVARRNNFHRSPEQVFTALRRSMPLSRHLQTKFPSQPEDRHKRPILRAGRNNCSVEVHATRMKRRAVRRT
jgi:hypothetical protein